MKVYKVGGAVRDKLIDYPFTDEDWVVVGAEPKELIDKGFIQVGVDFCILNLKMNTHLLDPKGNLAEATKGLSFLQVLR